MKIVKTIDEVRQLLHPYRAQGKKIALVPTMGSLHEGHLSLVDEAKKKASMIVMSIFVNPTQFGPGEDYESYPRQLEQDLALAESRGVTLVFMPDVAEMYPNEMLTSVTVSNLTTRLCGANRPGHFDGVATVVTKLLHIIQPDFAFFGIKDAQQVAVIQKLVEDLNLPVDIVPCPIRREEDGLALSSRNVYLTTAEREQAVVLSEALDFAGQRIESSNNPSELVAEVRAFIEKKPLATIDYVTLLSYPTLEPIDRWEDIDLLILAFAVRFGKTRLIDNQIMTTKGRRI